jgi:hypothetical protein
MVDDGETVENTVRVGRGAPVPGDIACGFVTL